MHYFSNLKELVARQESYYAEIMEIASMNNSIDEKYLAYIIFISVLVYL